MSYKIPFLICISGFLYVLIIFSYLGFMCFLQGINIQEIIISPLALSFIIFPEILTVMPFPNIWSFLFILYLISKFLKIFIFMFSFRCEFLISFYGYDK